MSYCQAILNMPESEKKQLHLFYHNHLYGFPLTNDNELFGRFVLEINQAGLSWELMLKKEKAFRKAYQNFAIKKVAHFGDEKINELLQNSGIIRNRLKIKAVIYNAQVILNLQKEYGSFAHWLQHHHPKSLNEWTNLFKKNFKFTGNEIVNEFLMSIGYLPGAHDLNCPIFKQVLKLNPFWSRT